MTTTLMMILGLFYFVSVALDLFFLSVRTLRNALRCDWINGFEREGEALCAAAWANERRSREDALEKQN